MTLKQPQDTRARILTAAEELSCQIGPAKVSLDAVAARAGVSKGGLLYHFPTKHDLLRAIVAAHVDDMRRALDAAADGSERPLDRARAYLRVMRAKLEVDGAPPGLFAAIAEDPEFVAPLRAFRRSMVEEVFGRCPEPGRATVAFLASEGLLHIWLTDPQGHDGLGRDEVYDTLDRMLDPEAAMERDPA